MPFLTHTTFEEVSIHFLVVFTEREIVYIKKVVKFRENRYILFEGSHVFSKICYTFSVN